MARRKRKKSNNTFFRVILVILVLGYGVYLSQLDGTYSTNKTTDVFNEVSTDLRVSYLDVGKVDSLLIENNGEFMLIDAGNNSDGELLV